MKVLKNHSHSLANKIYEILAQTRLHSVITPVVCCVLDLVSAFMKDFKILCLNLNIGW